MSLSVLDLAAAGGATLVAGAVNALAGGGTLISFPTLVAIGVPALPANVTNTVALCPGYFSGTWAQRQDLSGQRRRMVTLGVVAAAGGLGGAILLRVTPAATFRQAVPWLLVVSCILLLLQNRVRDLVTGRTTPPEPANRAPDGPAPSDLAVAGPAPADPAPSEPPLSEVPEDRPPDRPPSEGPGPRPSLALIVTVFLGAVYGGFFGAGLGIMLLALLGVFLDETMVRINAVKQVLQLVVNVTAAASFAVSGDVRWELVPVMAVAGVVGGTLGGRLSRVVDPTWLRRFVVVFGLAVAIDFWLT